MNYNPILFLLVLFPCTLTIAENPPADGFALLLDACANYEKNELDDDIDRELSEFIEKGGDYSKELVQAIKDQEIAFDLLRQASQAKTWTLPDKKKFTIDTKFEYLNSIRDLIQLGTAAAIIKLQQGKPDECLKSLVPFNIVSGKIGVSGALATNYVHQSTRRYQLPVIVSAVDQLPNDKLEATLAAAKAQYVNTPDYKECFQGDYHIIKNLIKDFYSKTRAGMDEDSLHRQIIINMERTGGDKKKIEQLKAGKILSVDQWEEQTLNFFNEIHAKAIDGLENVPSKDLPALSIELLEKINSIGEGVTLKTAQTKMDFIVIKRFFGKFSIEDAEAMHENIGNILTHEFFTRFYPPYTRMIGDHREHEERERLLLVHIASRFHQAKYGSFPTSLQQLVDTKLLNAEMIVDPLSGKEYLIKQKPKFLVYGVNRDLDDDGGVPWVWNPGNNQKSSGDLLLFPLGENENKK
ncbi:MAG: hypothetical protein COA78_01210 [Blastopirellula sp.]|nr:MAG: hypothetical protein COA78_01210 [Blastopirellula sp.]